MRIESYRTVDGVSFETSKEKLINLYGEPNKRRINRIGLEEFDYDSKVFRFSENGHLQEVTIDSKTIEIENKETSFAELKDKIMNEDTELFESYGFYVSPRFGIAFDPNYESWITCVSEKGLEKWKKI